MHIASAIGDQDDDYFVGQDPIDNAVRFEVDFTIVAIAVLKQLFRIGPRLGKDDRAEKASFDAGSDKNRSLG